MLTGRKVFGKLEQIERRHTVDASNVIVESVKWAEDGGGFIVRLYEAGKSGVATTVGFGVPVKSVSECNLLEERPSDPVVFSDSRVLLSFGPFEIKTLYCEM